MQRSLSDRLLMLKIKLALSTEKLNDAGQENFAGYIYSSMNRAFSELEAAALLKDAPAIDEKLNNVVSYLREIENVLLACKVGVALPLQNSTLATVSSVKNEILELIRRQQYAQPFVKL